MLGAWPAGVLIAELRRPCACARLPKLPLAMRVSRLVLAHWPVQRSWAVAQVWDRRALRGTRPAGVLIGHTEGITHLDPKRDGRYLLSNCKDQTARLWDIRKVPVSRTCTLHSLKACLWDIRKVPISRTCTLHLPQCLWDIRKVPAPCTCTLPSLNASGTSARWRSLASATLPLPQCMPSAHTVTGEA